jgi:anti-sigma B factor antagonist
MNATPTLALNIRWAHAHIAVAELRGLITVATVPQVRKMLLKLSKKDPATLVIDMTEACHLDCSGVATLVELLRALTQRGKKLRLAGLNQQLVQVIRLTQLDQIFEIYATVEEALIAEYQNQSAITLPTGVGRHG